jgi:hypothetical protein
LKSDGNRRQWGEAFEKRETEILGKEGFEGALAQIIQYQKALNIDDLAIYSPKSP